MGTGSAGYIGNERREEKGERREERGERREERGERRNKFWKVEMVYYSG
jgi:hypothetical protein